ncbi:unnamed protein product [Choristocarpus tenellus]
MHGGERLGGGVEDFGHVQISDPSPSLKMVGFGLGCSSKFGSRSLSSSIREDNPLKGLPHAIISNAMGFLNLKELSEVCIVCHSWLEAAEEDMLWSAWWSRCFKEDPPPCRGGKSSGGLKRLHGYRFDDPLVGDKMEVSWEGKFRLETMDVFMGRSWWGATVVQKVEGYRYRIHYPGWDSRWDEWVSRDRLRWPVDRPSLTEDDTLRRRDVVEVWCTGAHVQGAWLQAGVGKVKGDRVCLTNVLVASPRTIWVPRGNCRKLVISKQKHGAGGKGFPYRAGTMSKLDTLRLDALGCTLRGISAGVRAPLTGLERLRLVLVGR